MSVSAELCRNMRRQERARTTGKHGNGLLTRLCMADEQPNNPLHGLTLETILTRLVEKLGWAEMGRIVTIKCFTTDPSIKSSLTFLRKTPWARSKVEALYLQQERGAARRRKRRSVRGVGNDPLRGS